MKATEPFIMLPRSLLCSAAWQDLSLNAMRLVSFLMREHLAHGGRCNGHLIAPHRQLVELGIHPGAVTGTIELASDLGIVDVARGTGRAPNRFTLTWLLLPDGTEASNRWRHYVRPPKTCRRRRVAA
ncbi:hypothetical protein [Acidisphaera rubrifaciens]|uniref:Uncharacterized protein n=1 Tax=Acidisphaera rubrifaciens HS-AP3 TaxID=1231350 RepID=A0A0D6P8L7_9PROT|nr:hypothetical protein [Acidisphaera rubrifaciens]GAN78022.1 hypothetical protein Asru_0573_03 [Acidisphaera rubrifaciens HS-AP3]